MSFNIWLSVVTKGPRWHYIARLRWTKVIASKVTSRVGEGVQPMKDKKIMKI